MAPIISYVSGLNWSIFQVQSKAITIKLLPYIVQAFQKIKVVRSSYNHKI